MLGPKSLVEVTEVPSLTFPFSGESLKQYVAWRRDSVWFVSYWPAPVSIPWLHHSNLSARYFRVELFLGFDSWKLWRLIILWMLVFAISNSCPQNASRFDYIIKYSKFVICICCSFISSLLLVSLQSKLQPLKYFAVKIFSGKIIFFINSWR